MKLEQTNNVLLETQQAFEQANLDNEELQGQLKVNWEGQQTFE
jgi:hypothetical protein